MPQVQTGKQARGSAPVPARGQAPGPCLPLTILDELSLALAAHRAGRLDDAAAGYRRILDVDPGQPSALHLLGVLELGAGRARGALVLLRRAEVARPANADTRLALADA